MACYIIKRLPGSSNGVLLLIGMLLVTLATAIFHLVGYSLLNWSIEGVSANALNAALIFMSDFEVILSIIVSCIPSVRTWAREQAAKIQPCHAETHALEKSEGPGELSILRDE
jgi:hypothetical protein